MIKGTVTNRPVRLTRLMFVMLWITIMLSPPLLAANQGDTTAVSVKGVLVDAPECTVNSNNRIDVDFGDDVYISKIDGETYKKTQLVYSLSCSSLEDATLKLAITGKQAAFGHGLLQTDKAGLGIRLYHGDTVLSAGDGAANYVNFTWNGAMSGPDLYAVLVKDDEGEKPGPGDFTGSGTLLIDYQ